MKTPVRIAVIVAVLITASIRTVLADIVTFQVEWSGVANGNTAFAIAQIGIDTAGILNPGMNGSTIEVPSWLDSISLTVSDATSGNGTFTKDDFQ